MNLEQKDITQLNQFDSFLGFKVTQFDKQFFKSEARIRACFTGNQKGKCLGEHSLISTTYGGFVKIEDIKRGEIVPTINSEMVIEPRAVLSFIDSGVSHTLKVKM